MRDLIREQRRVLEQLREQREKAQKAAAACGHFWKSAVQGSIGPRTPALR